MLCTIHYQYRQPMSNVNVTLCDCLRKVRPGSRCRILVRMSGSATAHCPHALRKSTPLIYCRTACTLQHSCAVRCPSPRDLTTPRRVRTPSTVSRITPLPLPDLGSPSDPPLPPDSTGWWSSASGTDPRCPLCSGGPTCPTRPKSTPSRSRRARRRSIGARTVSCLGRSTWICSTSSNSTGLVGGLGRNLKRNLREKESASPFATPSADRRTHLCQTRSSIVIPS